MRPHPAEKTGHIQSGAIRLTVDGSLKQDSDIGLMIWKVPEMISYLSGLFELHPGDLIMSGTPSGVGAIVRGDVMEGHVDGLGSFTTRVS